MTADGVKFAHPLHHLQKSKEDLPLIAIDSFRHMYLFPKTEEMEVPGKLKQVNICIIYILYLHISYITYYMADSEFDWHLTHHRCMKVIYTNTYFTQELLCLLGSYIAKLRMIVPFTELTLDVNLSRYLALEFDRSYRHFRIIMLSICQCY